MRFQTLNFIHNAPMNLWPSKITLALTMLKIRAWVSIKTLRQLISVFVQLSNPKVNYYILCNANAFHMQNKNYCTDNIVEESIFRAGSTLSYNWIIDPLILLKKISLFFSLLMTYPAL